MTSSRKKTPTVLNSLNQAHHRILGNPEVVFLGEDILDPYGGAFKVSRGLSSTYPDRVITTPISEQAFLGIAAGMAIQGMRPIVEIMFGDFLTLAMDQLLNHIAKFHWMYNEQVTVPITIRTPMGGGSGYGPTHSQSLEKHFLGMPGLNVLAPSPFHDPGLLLEQSVLNFDHPTLFIENKRMYGRPLQTIDDSGRSQWLFTQRTDNPFPTVTLSYQPLHADSRPDVTLVTYGGAAEMAVASAKTLLLEDETVCELVVPSQLEPLDAEPIIESIRRTGRLVVLEEGTQSCGWGAEVITRITASQIKALRAAPVRIAAQNYPIACAPTLEYATLPQETLVTQTIREYLATPDTKENGKEIGKHAA